MILVAKHMVSVHPISAGGKTISCYFFGARNTILQTPNCLRRCATVAFGMGINKPDVRWVCHHTISKSLEGYAQESGRGGRDGRDSDVVLFYSYADKAKISFLLEKSQEEKGWSDQSKSTAARDRENLMHCVARRRHQPLPRPWPIQRALF